MICRREVALAVATMFALAAAPSLMAQDTDAYDKWGLAIGAQHQNVRGNARRFDQYVTQPAEVYVSELTWEHWSPGSALGIDLGLSDLGEPGAGGDLWLTWNDNIVLDATSRRSAFYADFLPQSGRSRRRDYDVEVGSPSSPGTGWGWQAAHNMVEVRGQPAAGPVNWEREADAARLDLRTSSYTISAQYAREDFNLLNTDYFSGESKEYGLSIASAGAGNTAFAGGYSWQTTDLDGRGRGVESQHGSLTLTHAASDNLSLSAEVGHRKIDKTITQNAYARESTTARFDGHYRVSRNTSVSGFWRTSEVDYVDGRQLNVVTATSDTVGGNIKTRISRELKFKGAYRRRDNDDRPLSYATSGALKNSLVWSKSERTDLSLTYLPNRLPGGAIVQWQEASWENDAQAASNEVETTSVTGWWQPPDKNFSLTASYTEQDFSFPLSQGVIAGVTFATDVESFVLGGLCHVSPETTLSLTYTDVTTDGAGVTDYRSIMLGFDHQRSPRERLSGSVTLGSFDDLIESDLDYDADLARIEWSREL